MYHCLKCDSCIDYQHKHSEFLGKCIGKDNAIAYWWFILANTIFNTMAFTCLVGCINMRNEEQPSGFVLSLVSCLVNIYEHNMLVIGAALLLTFHMMLDNFDKLLQLSIAVASKATMRELNDIWMHIHLFTVVKNAIDPIERVRQDIAEL